MSNNKIACILKKDDNSIEKNNDLVIDLNVRTSTMGEKQIDIRKFQQHGYYAFDPGLTSTAFCKSKITYINGEEGVLLYRGFPIDQLTTKSNYLEVCYILLNGNIPNNAEYKRFCNTINHYNIIPKEIIHFFQGFHNKSHPMAMMSSLTASLATLCYNEYLDFNIAEHRNIIACQLIAKMPILAAMCNKYLLQKKFVFPDKNLSYAGNFLHMLFDNSNQKDSTVNPIVERAFDQILILHADHEQNASTFTVRTVGSSGSNPFSCIAAGISSLWGSSHGGANEACLHMLEMIKTVEHIPKYINRAKDKRDSFKLMGFGHRIYKNYDPRAIVMRETCHKILKELKVSDRLFAIALELERIALNDSYFIERKLYPNVDFYSGITLKAMGIPTVMFTAIFAVARTIGWISHWKEMYENGLKIIRPRQLYDGGKRREFHKQSHLV